MTWQLAAFSILALALAAGFGWYERSRPDARIVALVGALAAFAALGRVAFAALPNVKPTTDIVLIAGYALGGAPGFVVGAVAGLTSNFFFGQGPWTPWQMAAWGATGVIGALLAVGTGRSGKVVGRWPLAVVCGVVGFAFAAVQDFGDWVTYSDHSARQLGVYVGKGIGFDVIHAAGCVAFALAFGPALARALRRIDRRVTVHWRSPAGALMPIMLAAVVLGGATALRHATPAAAASTPSGYLIAAQNPDGGFGASPGGTSSELYSGWVALGLAAKGVNPLDVTRGGHSLLAYIRAGAKSISDPGSLERTILVARAAGLPVTSFGSVALLSRLEHAIRKDGSVSDQANLTAFAVLAFRAAGVSPPGATLPWLIAQADSDGGFNFATAGGASDVDDTGAVLEALAGVHGAADPARTRAIGYLRRTQNRDGGFPQSAGAPSNAQSTAFAVQGLIAAGVDPATVHSHSSVSPLRFLDTLIGADGHVHYSRTSDQTPVWVTAEAAMALAGKPLPIAPVARSGGSGSGHRKHHPFRGHRTRQPAHPKSTRHRPSHRTQRRTTAAPHALTETNLLATGAGILTALALAPIGLS